MIAVVTPGTLVFNGNNYWNQGGSSNVSIYWNGTQYSSLSAWQSGASQDSHAVAVLPQNYVPGGGWANGGYVPQNLYAYNLPLALQ